MCDKYFEDSEGKVEILDKKSVVLEINPEAHDWDEGKITKEATCKEEGIKTYTCKNNSKHTKEESIPKITSSIAKIETEKEKINKTNSPKTGDNIMLWVALMLVSSLGVLETAKYIRKK